MIAFLLRIFYIPWVSPPIFIHMALHERGIPHRQTQDELLRAERAKARLILLHETNGISADEEKLAAWNVKVFRSLGIRTPQLAHSPMYKTPFEFARKEGILTEQALELLVLARNMNEDEGKSQSQIEAENTEKRSRLVWLSGAMAYEKLRIHMNGKPINGDIAVFVPDKETLDFLNIPNKTSATVQNTPSTLSSTTHHNVMETLFTQKNNTLALLAAMYGSRLHEAATFRS